LKKTTMREELFTLLEGDELMKTRFRRAVQEVLEAEMEDTLFANKSECRAYRSGDYVCKLTTRTGTMDGARRRIAACCFARKSLRATSEAKTRSFSSDRNGTESDFPKISNKF
jgi:hypothetical protein